MGICGLYPRRLANRRGRDRRDQEALSTAAVRAYPVDSWKQEVNRRLAEHRGHKPAMQPEPPFAVSPQHNASRRAQEAAARVAARYAKVPSYSEMLATEARAALRVAKAASEAAFHATAAAESMLAGLEAASASEVAVEPVAQAAEFSSSAPTEELAEKNETQHRAGAERPASVRWAAELPSHPTASADLHTGNGQSLFEDEWWKPASAEPVAPGAGEVEVVEPAQPIFGNLLEFPSEVVATRKVRPRLTESPTAADEAQTQLSIFEVDPVTVATTPSTDAVEAASAEWAQPAWSGLELDTPSREEEELLEEEAAARRQPAHEMQPASLDRRMMAFFIDGILIAGSVVGVAAMVLHEMTALPGMRAIEIGMAISLAVIAALYVTLFYAVAPATPGMRYAGIRFCTFEGTVPTRSQRWGRLAAMLLSVLPAGLGLAWSLFDDDRLCWHDRLSRTYICNRYGGSPVTAGRSHLS